MNWPSDEQYLKNTISKNHSFRFHHKSSQRHQYWNTSIFIVSNRWVWFLWCQRSGHSSNGNSNSFDFVSHHLSPYSVFHVQESHQYGSYARACVRVYMLAPIHPLFIVVFSFYLISHYTHTSFSMLHFHLLNLNEKKIMVCIINWSSVVMGCFNELRKSLTKPKRCQIWLFLVVVVWTIMCIYRAIKKRAEKRVQESGQGKKGVN